mgnify:FL=1
MFLHLVVILSCAKLLLLPCYTSTDFEVHRNWLAITHSLPLEEWYLEDTSEWTLDYPPFFAWFEWALAKLAIYFDEKMLVINHLNYKSVQAVMFQRMSVIVTDLVLAVGVKICSNAITQQKQENETTTWLPILILTNAGLFIVDHIHFQYNGFLFGIFLSSIGCMLADYHLTSALLFAVLLNFKHIFLYCAPAYFIYLLSSCRSQDSPFFGFSFCKLFKLALIVLTTFGLSVGPFFSQKLVLFQRLFPFKRGLTHAYWAPNFWALYNFTDRLFSFCQKKIGIELQSCDGGASTKGLVTDTIHCTLPSVPPVIPFVLTLSAQLPILWKLWFHRGNPVQFLRALILCNFCSFMFGWHVHEKAILLMIIPMAVLAVVGNPPESVQFLLLSSIGNFSLFPLLYEERETVIKCLLLLCHILAIFIALFKRRKNKQCTSIGQTLVLISIPMTFLLSEFVLRLVPTLQFLPLMIYSLFSSIGVSYVFLEMYRYYLNAK